MTYDQRLMTNPESISFLLGFREDMHLIKPRIPHADYGGRFHRLPKGDLWELNLSDLHSIFVIHTS